MKGGALFNNKKLEKENKDLKDKLKILEAENKKLKQKVKGLEKENKEEKKKRYDCLYDLKKLRDPPKKKATTGLSKNDII